MNYGRVPGVDKPVARVVQGALMIRSEVEEESSTLLDEVFEQGGTTFDTAHQYGGGDSERTFGRWVRERDVRDEVVVIGKGAHHNADRKRITPFDITADLFDSLARFGFDHVDLYLLHRDDPSVPVGPIVEVLNEHLSGAGSGPSAARTGLPSACGRPTTTPVRMASPRSSPAAPTSASPSRPWSPGRAA